MSGALSVFSDATLAELSADDVLRLWERVARVKAVRSASPELRQAILDHVDELGPEVAAEVRAALEHSHPVAVVVSFWPDKPALGAFPKPERSAPDPVAVFGATRLLDQFVREMLVFTRDRQRVVNAAIELADQLGVPQPEADAIIAGVVHGGRNVG
jgi:hypothetical protein